MKESFEISIVTGLVDYDATDVTYDHVDGELEFRFDDLYQYFLADVTILVWLAAQRHESVQVLIDVTFNIIVKLLVFIPFDRHEQSVHVCLLQILCVKELLHAHKRFVG